MQAWTGMFAASQHLGVVSPDYSVFKTIVPSEIKFFEYLFRTPLMVSEFASRSRGIGTGFNRLYTSAFGDIWIAVPPLCEQRSIVQFLDYMDSRIQRLIRVKQRMIDLLAEQRSAIIHNAVTRGLDPTVDLRSTNLAWLGHIPADWKVGRLKSLMRNIVDLTDERRATDLYIAMENVESCTGKLTVHDCDVVFESQVKRFQAEDILFGKLRPYLAKVTKPTQNGVCAGEFLVLRPIQSRIDPSYMAYMLRSKPFIDEIDKSTYGAKMPRANWSFISRLEIAVPSPFQQSSIAAFLDQYTASLDAAVTSMRRVISLLLEYRIRLISDVVTGKLDVRDAAERLQVDSEDSDKQCTYAEAGEECIDSSNFSVARTAT